MFEIWAHDGQPAREYPNLAAASAALRAEGQPGFIRADWRGVIFDTCSREEIGRENSDQVYVTGGK
jgi:hypothetical protein